MAAPREARTSEAEEYFWGINVDLGKTKSGNGILSTVAIAFSLVMILWRCGITTTVTD